MKPILITIVLTSWIRGEINTSNPYWPAQAWGEGLAKFAKSITTPLMNTKNTNTKYKKLIYKIKTQEEVIKELRRIIEQCNCTEPNKKKKLSIEIINPNK